MKKRATNHLLAAVLGFQSSILLETIALPALATGESRSGVELRVFSREDVEKGLESLGVSARPRDLVRLPAAAGVRVALESGEAVEIRCDGTTTRKHLPGRVVYFDSDGTPFAWYEDQRLVFSDPAPDPNVGNEISVDPEGRFLITTDGTRPDRPTRVYSTSDLSRPVGTVPVAGRRTRIFSGDGGILVVGDAGSEGGRSVVVIAYEFIEGRLSEVDRMSVPEPDVWFGGWLVAEDGNPSATELAFRLWRDPPFSDKLYEYSIGSGKLRHSSKLGYAAYVSCNPFGGASRK